MEAGSVFALSAGLLAAGGSLAAKLSVAPDQELCESGPAGWIRWSAASAGCDWLHIPLRVLCGVLLLTCNTLMWTMFSKALRHCSSSAGATVITTASNFISSAFIGRLIFGETHSALWWVGISLTLCGLLVLHSATPPTNSQEAEKKDT